MSEDAGQVDYVAGRVALKKFFEACLPLALTGNPSAHSLVILLKAAFKYKKHLKNTVQ